MALVPVTLPAPLGTISGRATIVAQWLPQLRQKRRGRREGRGGKAKLVQTGQANDEKCPAWRSMANRVIAVNGVRKIVAEALIHVRQGGRGGQQPRVDSRRLKRANQPTAPPAGQDLIRVRLQRAGNQKATRVQAFPLPSLRPAHTQNTPHRFTHVRVHATAHTRTGADLDDNEWILAEEFAVDTLAVLPRKYHRLAGKQPLATPWQIAPD